MNNKLINKTIISLSLVAVALSFPTNNLMAAPTIGKDGGWAGNGGGNGGKAGGEKGNKH